MSRVNCYLVGSRVYRIPAHNDATFKDLIARQGKEYKQVKPPSLATMERWSDNGVAKATDGCKVEPDGECPHGHKSWMMVMGVI